MWGPAKQTPAVVTQERRCSYDAMYAGQATVQNPVDTH